MTYCYKSYYNTRSSDACRLMLVMAVTFKLIIYPTSEFKQPALVVRYFHFFFCPSSAMQRRFSSIIPPHGECEQMQ